MPFAPSTVSGPQVAAAAVGWGSSPASRPAPAQPGLSSPTGSVGSQRSPAQPSLRRDLRWGTDASAGVIQRNDSEGQSSRVSQQDEAPGGHKGCCHWLCPLQPPSRCSLLPASCITSWLNRVIQTLLLEKSKLRYPSICLQMSFRNV